MGFKEYFQMELKRSIQPLEQIEYLDAGNGKNVFKLLMVSLITQTSPNVSYMDGQFDFDALYRMNCGDTDPKLEGIRDQFYTARPDAYKKLLGIVTTIGLEAPKTVVDQYSADGRYGLEVFDDGKNKYYLSSFKKTKKGDKYYLGGDILIPNDKYVGVSEDNSFIDGQGPFVVVRCGIFIEPENAAEICLEMKRYLKETGLPEDLTLTIVFTTNKVSVQKDATSGETTGYTMNVSDWIPFETTD
jgi:hypothetical protein